MKLTTIVSVTIAFLAAPLIATPAPQPLEVTLSIDSDKPTHPAAELDWQVSLRFVGADPQIFYDVTANVSTVPERQKEFKISQSIVSYPLLFLLLFRNSACPTFAPCFHGSVVLTAVKSIYAITRFSYTFSPPIISYCHPNHVHSLHR